MRGASLSNSNLHYFPLAARFVLLLFLILAVLVALVEFGILSYAYEKLGLPHRVAFALLIASLLGAT